MKNFAAVQTKKTSVSKSQVRTMLTCVFDFNGTAKAEAFYKDQESMEPIVQVCWMEQGVNCSSETGFITLKTFWLIVHESKTINQKLLTTQTAYPGYSPDMALNNFWPCQKLILTTKNKDL